MAERYEMNIFKLPYSPWRWLSNWPRNIRSFFRRFKWAYQRITQGYCDDDKWDLDMYYTQLFIDSLRDLAANGTSYPGTAEFPTYEVWAEYLNKIADFFEKSIEGNAETNPYEYYITGKFTEDGWTQYPETSETKELGRKWYKTEIHLGNLRRAYRDRAMSMLQHVLGTLWD